MHGTALHSACRVVGCNGETSSHICLSSLAQASFVPDDISYATPILVAIALPLSFPLMTHDYVSQGQRHIGFLSYLLHQIKILAATCKVTSRLAEVPHE